MVEHRTENPGVPGSIPGGTTAGPFIAKGPVAFQGIIILTNSLQILPENFIFEQIINSPLCYSGPNNSVMKQSLFIFIAIVIAASCTNQKTSKGPAVDIEKEKEMVALVLEKYVIANEKQDIEMVHDIWAPEPDIVVFGTNSDEKLMGWEAIKAAVQRQFSSFEDTYISIHDQIINVDDMGRTAWFSEIVNYNYIYQGQTMQYEGLRFTGVLRKFGDDWLIVQSHMSIPGSAE